MLEFIYYLLYAFVIAVAIFFAWKLIVAYKLFLVPFDDIEFKDSDDDLPSVSVCIPARNETHTMTQCLEMVINSDYPKVEIIVLDDSSVDDTSVLIKSFAHAGVRFVEGSPLPDDWLGKNHAYENLLTEASGSYILFMDVDTQIRTDTISRLVAYATNNKAMMVSVLPRRNDGWRTSVVMTTLRYFWELILHSRTNPASASNAWMIHRHTLQDEIGGFAKYRLDVRPESHLAAYLMKSGRYRFLLSGEWLGVSFEKKWQSQVETSIRLLLPIVGGKIHHAVFAMILLLVLNLPFFTILASVVTGWTWLQWVSLWLIMVFSAIYATYSMHVWRRGWWLGGLLWPVLILQESVLMALSIVRYSTGKVTWKGRPILAPKIANKLTN